MRRNKTLDLASEWSGLLQNIAFGTIVIFDNSDRGGYKLQPDMSNSCAEKSPRRRPRSYFDITTDSFPSPSKNNLRFVVGIYKSTAKGFERAVIHCLSQNSSDYDVQNNRTRPTGPSSALRAFVIEQVHN